MSALVQASAPVRPAGSVRLNTLLLTGAAPRFDTCLPP